MLITLWRHQTRRHRFYFRPASVERWTSDVMGAMVTERDWWTVRERPGTCGRGDDVWVVTWWFLTPFRASRCWCIVGTFATNARSVSSRVCDVIITISVFTASRRSSSTSNDDVIHATSRRRPYAPYTAPAWFSLPLSPLKIDDDVRSDARNVFDFSSDVTNVKKEDKKIKEVDLKKIKIEVDPLPPLQTPSGFQVPFIKKEVPQAPIQTTGPSSYNDSKDSVHKHVDHNNPWDLNPRYQPPLTTPPRYKPVRALSYPAPSNNLVHRPLAPHSQLFCGSNHVPCVRPMYQSTRSQPNLPCSFSSGYNGLYNFLGLKLRPLLWFVQVVVQFNSGSFW